MLALFLLWPITLPLLIGYLALLWKLFKRRARFGFVIVLAFPFVAYEALQYYWFAEVLPAKIVVTYPISITDEGGLLDGCGSAVYKISDETLAAIRKEGLAFFRDATHARGHRGEPYYDYATWQETPVPPAWTSEGSWIICSTLTHDIHAQIVEAAKRQGAYYTSKPEGQLVVVPSLGYVVFTFDG